MTHPIQEMIDKVNAEPPVPIPERLGSVDNMITDTLGFVKSQIIGTDEDGDGAELLPTWTLLTASGYVLVIATPFETGSQGKDMIAEGLRKLMREAHVIRYTFASEAWTASQTTDWQPHDQPPSERNDRKEVVMITGADRKNGETVRIWDIVRNADGEVVDLKFNHELKGDMSEGRFTHMLEDYDA